MNMVVIRRSRWMALIVAIVLAAAAGYALAPRSHPPQGLGFSARELAARIQSGTGKPGDPIFMNVPGMPGESTAPGHRNWIDLTSWDFTTVEGDGSPIFTLTVKAPATRATPPLLLAIPQGTLLPTVTLQAAQTSRTGLTFDFLTITLSQVTVLRIDDNSTGGRPTDTIAFSFKKVDYKYQLGGKKYDFCWDNTTITSCTVP